MAVYKVPQDVEADDKLLGPFSFRQFIYLIIVAMAIGMGYLLAQVFIGLIIIPLPIIVFFGALALPLKKDQPMEAYLGALVSFYILKPRKRFWTPDGLNELVEITAPREVEPDRVKDITGYEARARLGYLTDIVESRGWAVRGAGVPTHGVSSMNNEALQEAQEATDMLDDTAGASQNFDKLIEQKTAENRTQLMNNMRQQAAAPQAPATAVPSAPQAAATSNIGSPQPTPATAVQPNATNIRFNPYPNDIKQSVIQPIGASTNQNMPAANITPQSTSVKPPSPDIIKLANESEGLTVAAVAQQARRIESREDESAGLLDGEVQISLR